MNSRKRSVNEADAEIRLIVRNLVKSHLSAEETTQYLDNKLSKTSRLRVDAHIALCSECAEKLDLLVAYRGKSSGKPLHGIVREINRRLAHAPVVLKKQQENSTHQLLFAIRKKPGVLSYMHPTKPKPQSRHFIKLTEMILPYNIIGMGISFGANETDWSKPIYDDKNAKRYFYTYKVDGQGNLLINVTVNVEGYDKVSIVVNGKETIEDLEFNGKVWTAQKIFSATERSNFTINDSIAILPIRN